jgi:hypothetical protein
MKNEVELLVEYIRSRPEFEIVTELDGNYGHMGAALTDAVLQAGVNYKFVVRPRVHRLLTEYPQATTTSDFLRLLGAEGHQGLLSWKGGRKIDTLLELARLLASEGVETEDDFRTWSAEPENRKRLRRIKGIKDKTLDYIEILLGGQSVAVDRHLYRFLAEAGVPTSGYADAHTLIRDAAGVLGISASLLDHSIWKYMSERLPRA